MVMLREEDGEVFTKGDALIELGKNLGGVFWVLAFGFSIFPKLLRNGLYDLIAKNRYKLAGSCELPDEGLMKRIRE
jgi:predicted DCC family thiol-disulfide oxidoreductase YuxK